MKTGKELWNQKFADAKEGYYATSAPIVANGVLLSGMAGGEFTTRGFIDGWDPETGKKLWRRHTIPAPGEPGSETWPKNSDAWKYGGGPTWRSGSYDPALDLVYWGTGNAEPYDPRPRGGLDSLYTSSVLAIRPKTGEIACHYQYTPNDVYDVDGADEHLLADIPVNGQIRKVMIQPNKNGFLYVLDRTNCALIAAHPFVKVNWASHVDLATGRPVLTDVYKRFLAGEEVEIWPSRSTNAVPIAFNPTTNLVYATTWNIARIQKLAPPAAFRARRQIDRHHRTHRTAEAGRHAGLFPGDGPDHGQEKVGDPAAAAEFSRRAGDRRRTALHRLADRRVRGAGRSHGQDPVAIQDRLERQLDRHHLRAQGAPVRDHRLGPGRWPREPVCRRHHPGRRCGVDVRGDGVSRFRSRLHLGVQGRRGDMRMIRLNVVAALSVILLSVVSAAAQTSAVGQLAELVALNDKVGNADTRVRVDALHRVWSIALASSDSEVKVAAIGLLLEPIGSSSDHIRMPAVYAVAEIANSTDDPRVKTRALGALAEPLQSTQVPMRNVAIDALNGITRSGRSGEVALAAVKALAEPIRSGNNGVRIPAINALVRAVEGRGHTASYQAAIDLLVAPLDSNAAIGGLEVRMMAVAALEKIGREATDIGTRAKAMGLLQAYGSRSGWEPEARKRAQEGAARIEAGSR